MFNVASIPYFLIFLTSRLVYVLSESAVSVHYLSCIIKDNMRVLTTHSVLVKREGRSFCCKNCASHIVTLDFIYSLLCLKRKYSYQILNIFYIFWTGYHGHSVPEVTRPGNHMRKSEQYPYFAVSQVSNHICHIFHITRDIRYLTGYPDITQFYITAL